MIDLHRYPLIAATPGNAVMGVDASRVRVPEALNNATTELTATGVVIVISFSILLAVTLHLLSKIKTEQKSQSALQTALEAMKTVVENANEQTRIAQQVNATQERNAKMLLDAQASRIRELTDVVMRANEVADRRVAAAVEASESRYAKTFERLHGRIDVLERMRDGISEAVANRRGASIELEPA